MRSAPCCCSFFFGSNQPPRSWGSGRQAHSTIESSTSAGASGAGAGLSNNRSLRDGMLETPPLISPGAAVCAAAAAAW